MQLTSSAFDEGGPIPPEHTCDGADTSPPLAWTGVPDGTVAFALVVRDPDAGGFVHWVLIDIPADVRDLRAGEGDSIGTAGPNDFGRPGWGGPCPPSGRHRYEFTLVALDEPLGLAGPDATADAVLDAAEGTTLARAALAGVYTRE